MKLKELSPRMPVTVTKEDSLLGAATQLAEEEIGALVVFDTRGLVGIISERDIVRAIADGCELHDTEVGEYMTESPVVTDAETEVEVALSRMSEAGIRHLVVASGRDVTGVISIRDLARALAPVQVEV